MIHSNLKLESCWEPEFHSVSTRGISSGQTIYIFISAWKVVGFF